MNYFFMENNQIQTVCGLGKRIQILPEKSVDKSMTSFKEEMIADDRLIKYIREEQSIMGRFSLREGLMVVSFTLLVLAWLFRDPKLFDGWGQYLDGVTKDGSKV